MASVTPPRCRSCQRPLERRANEPLIAFLARRYCAPRRSCTGQGRLRAEYPGAVKAETLPRRCGRCGGPWRVVSEGVTCALCAHGVAVVEALTSQAGRRW